MTGPQARIRELFAGAGVRGWLHAVRIDPDGPGPEVAVDPDGRVVMASVYKLPLLVAFCRAVDEGALDPVEPVRLLPEARTAGPTGVSAMSDPVTMSLRDVARSMIIVSDNAAADALLDAVGLARVHDVLRVLGLHATTVRGGTRDTYDTLVRDTDADTLQDAMSRLADNDRPADPSALDPLLSSATTGRDMTRLLTAIWSDTAASPAQCAYMRTVLGQQVWPHRLAAGFPHPAVRVAGKTGTLGPLRHEVGVVQYRGEPPVAVAVFTRAARAEVHLPAVDAVIGSTARVAVGALRV
ncbi:serine hydrolase [Pseudonocardia humida]|uniref:Serine hydrolase n=1 Tax=Pseudonocardia humida TaxID=2800819 RepID=A0ABT1A089_9PSEU|nr:serine hydrolase [Pseudonocardia humida]MCO1656376.1 serine hydrolase [Pseudonocardia humida]